MKLKLIFPPHFDTSGPYPSLPALTAFLRERGMDVSQEDLNIAAFDYLMRPEHLERCREKLEARYAGFEKNRARIRGGYDEYREICLGLLSAPIVARHIEKAVGFFRKLDRFFQPEAYALNHRIVTEAFNLVSAAFYPTTISLYDFSMPYSTEVSEDIFTALNNASQNPYQPFLNRYVAENLRTEAPDLVGISIAGPGQIIPGLSLAQSIRGCIPEAKIVLGGPVLSVLAGQIRRLPRLFGLFDYLILGEGETPLLRLCHHLAGKCPIEQVPNLLYMAEGEVKDTGWNSFENMDGLPTPVYDGLPLDRYPAPVPILSLEPARGCFWGKCAFCTSMSLLSNCRFRSTHKVAEDMARLRSRYGAGLLRFTNEGLPARYFSELAEVMIQRGLRVPWFANARLEKDFTLQRLQRIAESGCGKLCFGLESGSPRVIKAMRKGIRLDEVPGILSACKNAGVDVHLYLMIGFPTETEAEIKQTRDFVMRLLDVADTEGFSFYVALFTACLGAPILERLPEWGYRLVSKGKGHDLERVFDFEPAGASAVQLSPARLSQLARQMANKFGQRLPKFAPEGINDRILYRVIPHAGSDLKTPKKTLSKASFKTAMRGELHVRMSPWVTVRSFHLKSDDAKSSGKNSLGLARQWIAYDFLTNSCYRLDQPAARILARLRSPMTINELIGRPSPKNSNGRLSKQCLDTLRKRELIEISNDVFLSEDTGIR